MPFSIVKPVAWVSPLPCHRINPTCIPHRARSHSRRLRPYMTARGAQRLQLVTVPDESHMATPGEVRHVALDYTLFQAILQSGSTTFGMLTIDHWHTRRGCVLSILNVRTLLPDASPRVEVECRCSGRFDATTEPAVPPAWTLLSADCNPVADWPVYEARDRLELAAAEWRVWKGCREVAELMRRVRATENVGVEQELAVWAPKEYDREITAEEWKATPLVTRHVWCERAESFSFGVLRCMHASEEIMVRARGITNTLERLELGMACIEVRRARTRAELSLKDIFN